jgi:hypothetical protein
MAATPQPGEERFDELRHCVAVFDAPEWISTERRVILAFDVEALSAAVFDHPEGNST